MRRLPALVAVLLLSACAGEEEATETVTVTVTGATTTPAPGSWKGLPEPLPADGKLPVGEFNAYAETVDEPWERDLAATIDEFIGRDENEAPSVSFQATSGPEGGGPTSASLLLDGLLDDSVRARRYQLMLDRRQDGTWRIDSATWAQRCHEGRGHQAFTPALCT